MKVLFLFFYFLKLVIDYNDLRCYFNAQTKMERSCVIPPTNKFVGFLTQQDEKENKMEIYIKKLDPDAILPKYAHDRDAGMDVFANHDKTLEPHCWGVIRTGIAIALPPNTECQVRPRSGLAANHGISVLNSPGTIDEGYRGEVGVILINHSENVFEVKKGMKIAQLVLASFVPAEISLVEELPQSSRGARGFGSSGLN